MKQTQITDKTKWLQMRSKNINSTESSALYGLNKYQTVLDLFLEKKSGAYTEIEETDRMALGTLMEPSIAEFAAKKMGCEVAPFKDYLEIPEARMGSSFDYEITSGERKGWILEIKMVDYLIFKNEWDEDEGEAPDHIEIQVQHQMEVADRPGCVIACLVGGNDLKLVYRERNKKVGAALRKKIADFWLNVENNVVPGFDYLRDYDMISALNEIKTTDLKEFEPGSDMHEMLIYFNNLKQTKKQTEEEIKIIQSKIIEQVGEYSGVYIHDKEQEKFYQLKCGFTKDSPDKKITADMVGNIIKGRKGHRRFNLKFS